MSEKISVIVPVFKVEKYLDRCIESLISQTYENIEIILVDDKSPDNCPQMCDDWAKKDNRIKVVHKEKNEGLGFARNSGIEVISGDYVIFVDSDDYINSETCKTALSRIKEYKADICCYNSIGITDGKEIIKNTVNQTTVFEENEIISRFLAQSIAPSEANKYYDYGIGFSACMLMYKAKLFENKELRFVSEREFINEDLLFRINLCKFVKKAIIIPDRFYYYYHNSGTLTTSYRKDRFDEYIKMYQKATEAVEPFCCIEINKRVKRHFLINILVCFKQEVFSGSKKNIKKMCKNKTLYEVLNSYPINKLPPRQRLFYYAIKIKSPMLIMLLVKARGQR